jgi:hypothetical protein
MQANAISAYGHLVHALDPVKFAEACGITCDKWQAAVLRSSSKRALLLCSRQSGKSTVTALAALHVALFSGGLVVIVSPSQRQSGEMIRTIRGFIGHLGLKLGETALKIEFDNGGRIVALPGSERTVRGLSAASLVVVDEAARCGDELLVAVRPMLATTNGRLIALSTPAGRRGFFFEAWHSADSDWLRIRVSVSQCERISKEFLATELKTLGAQRYSEEYELEFRDSDEAVFPFAIIEAAFREDIKPLWP